MLNNLSERVRLRYERATEAKERADETLDPEAKADFVNMERRWLLLARSYEFGERLDDFTRENARQAKMARDLSAVSPINILIVDDDPRNLTVLEAILNDPGCRLVRAESAEEAQCEIFDRLSVGRPRKSGLHEKSSQEVYSTASTRLDLSTSERAQPASPGCAGKRQLSDAE